ncbi:MAG: L-seryl-tRNA(Sec) selenium transferase [Candidatus Nephthysia bennettiae]|uniref:L-seryl-tRNA(Sec) selenium transferase n=1 Tax=Candidatus Nephthysia bennettiae TaxID=3127016 RepID=A0A934K2R1_9BACT|nr:L-seryl-tRNA(Sec) selenium transferase [Candidatus Dormibacteraeota bacterium]MBJ7614152.1 L-seryl-tRNA(Sec) selenium transferase [Candidatus Dormibacteraeota bacterium]PZR97839.1 MAG: L-seryl-tRNA(Sec) selenium transferase [Candidatus Dormibacteraeota bacterium]
MHRIRQPASLPAVGSLLNEPAYLRLRERYPRALVTDALREQLAEERERGVLGAEERVAAVAGRLAEWATPRLRRVINGAGVVLHTNLGRAPLSKPAAAAAANISAGYSNLELDLESGRRGDRSTLVEPALRRLTGAEAGLVVNNNAAAVLLSLAALAGRREVVVSRGQQVEIGGSFRMPDVMRLSGARMVEVGTTNRTRAADYDAAVGPRTAALLRVHTSNFRVTGFTESPSLRELAEVARSRGILLIDDLGSGALEPASDEPTVAESLEHADVTTFSGDKLLGGPQAGIALGRTEPIRKMAKHPLARAVRVDKMTLAALEATLRERLLGHPSPVDSMLAATPQQIRRRAGFLMVRLAENGVESSLLEAGSAAGGGSLPGEVLPTTLLALEGRASRLAAALRAGDPPVIARIEQGRCCIDLRTVLLGEDDALQQAIEAAVGRLSAGR